MLFDSYDTSMINLVQNLGFSLWSRLDARIFRAKNFNYEVFLNFIESPLKSCVLPETLFCTNSLATVNRCWATLKVSQHSKINHSLDLVFWSNRRSSSFKILGSRSNYSRRSNLLWVVWGNRRIFLESFLCKNYVMLLLLTTGFRIHF